jgi:hypothetical protein
MKLKGKMFGGRSMVATLKAIAKQFPDDVGKALYQEAQIEATEMKRRTPVDTGMLRASIHTEGPERESGRIIKIIFATGANVPYAIYVHEDPDAFHKVGEWKFMESVIKEAAPWMAERVGKRLNLDNYKKLKVIFSEDTQFGDFGDE